MSFSLVPLGGVVQKYVLFSWFMSFSLVLAGMLCGNMKICSRYPNPKSLPSGKGLTIASLQFFLCFVFCFVSFSLVLMGRLCRNMKICSRYPNPKSLFLIRRTIIKGTTKIRQNHRCGPPSLLFIILHEAPKGRFCLPFGNGISLYSVSTQSIVADMCA